MSLFSKPKAVLWPKSDSVQVYLDRSDNNTFSLDINLWKPRTEEELKQLGDYYRQNHINQISVLLPDDIIVTKSFIYDSKISKVDPTEIASLAKSQVNFDIKPELIEYSLSYKDDKTLIRSTIIDSVPYNILVENLTKLGLSIEGYWNVSSSIANIVATFNPNEYFFIYPVGKNEVTIFLAKGNAVYLTSPLKGVNLDIQKILNYSNLYFDAPTNKLYLPSEGPYDIISSKKLDQTTYDEKQIAQNLGKPSNLPLPVVGILSQSTLSKPAPAAIISEPTNNISNQAPPMQNKKNILPVIAVFILTAAIASIIYWFIANRGQGGDLNNPSSQNITPTAKLSPTEIPTPTPSISKDIKIQVLNATEINGQAATLKQKLTDLGFTDIAVGNSTKSLTANEVELKTDQASAQAYFQSELGTFFPATYTTDLAATSDYDVVFYIGTDLRESSTGTSPTVTEADTAPPSTSTATPKAEPTE